MKKLFFTLLLLFTLGAPALSEQMLKMAVDIHVHKNASITVREDMLMDFDVERHGIYRDIHVRDRTQEGTSRRIRVKVESVTDGAGGARPYKLMRHGDSMRVRIGDADVYVKGQQRYVLTYTVKNALLFWPTYDELYWNATGDQWDFPIQSAVCTVHLPEGVPSSKIRLNAFVGAFGSTEGGKFQPGPGGGVFWSPRPLQLGEQLTIAAAWPKGYVTPVSALQKLVWFAGDNSFVFLPIVWLAGLIYLWMRAGRDPDAGISETVRYEPPGDLRPAELGAMVDECVNLVDITSTVVDLAVRGYLTITEVTPTGWFSSASYTLDKTTERKKEDPRGGLSRYEQRMYDKIFAKGDSVSTDDLKNSFYKVLPSVKSEIYSSLVKHGYFSRSPESVRGGYGAFGIAILVAAAVIFVLLMGGNSLVSPWWAASVGVCGLLTLLAARAMPRKTLDGRKAYVDCKGFEEYLTRAEVADIHLQEKKNMFEVFLPYAVALGVADKWARAFADIYTEPPDWYSGSGWSSGSFEPLYFTRSLKGAMISMGSAMVAQPRSASGGGSSFGGGGGGFSGGGFGGGGGGSW